MNDWLRLVPYLLQQVSECDLGEAFSAAAVEISPNVYNGC